MLKVFLVEDEITVRDSIKRNIPWEKEGFVFVGEAGDGELAFPLIQKTQPDILITDIRMPFMDGLELSRLVHQELPRIKILILSGYDEFTYAREAISVGVTDYLLKPLDAVAITQALRRVADIIAEEQSREAAMQRLQQENLNNRKSGRSGFFHKIISRKLSYTEILQEGKAYHMDLTGSFFRILLFQIFINEADGGNGEIKQQALDAVENIGELRPNVFLFPRGTEGDAFLLCGNSHEELDTVQEELLNDILSCLKDYRGLDYFGGIGQSVERLGELYISFDTANKVFCYRYLTEKNRVLHYSEKNNLPRQNREENLDFSHFDLKKLGEQAITNFLRRGTTAEVDSFVDDLIGSLKETRSDSFLIRQYIAVDWNLAVISFTESLGGDVEQVLGNRLDFKNVTPLLQSSESMRLYLKDLLNAALNVRNQKSSDKYSELLDKAKVYIRSHFAEEEISLNTVAGSVSISPSHFSSIFRQEEGQTFVEFLTAVRMDRAKELLRCSSKKSSEIAYEVGYKDPHYFAYLFKKTQGCTPTEYRARGKDA